MNQLQALALNEGVRRRKGLWSKAGRKQLESLRLAPWGSGAGRICGNCWTVSTHIGELTAAVEQEAERRPEARRLMTHPGVGPITALAFTLILGPVERFASSKQVSSYLSLTPCEESSGQRKRLGHISKQGNTLLRFLLVEAAQAVVRCDPEWRGRFLHLALRRGRSIAQVAMARRLAVHLYGMTRQAREYRPSAVSVRTPCSSKLSHGVQ